MADDMCFIRSMHTEAINHEPAITLHADRQPDHRPALPRRVDVATASARSNENLPTFVVLVAEPTNTEQVQAISARLWSVGLSCPASTPACSFRTGGDPILYINNPPGVSPRRAPQDARRPERS